MHITKPVSDANKHNTATRGYMFSLVSLKLNFQKFDFNTISRGVRYIIDNRPFLCLCGLRLIKLLSLILLACVCLACVYVLFKW